MQTNLLHQKVINLLSASQLRIYSLFVDIILKINKNKKKQIDKTKEVKNNV